MAWEQRRQLCNALSGVKLSGPRCRADGFFQQENLYSVRYESQPKRADIWGGSPLEFSIQLRNDNWEIIGRTEPEPDERGVPEYNTVVCKTLWKCPRSGNMPLPPERGWVGVGPLATARNLELIYVYEKNDDDDNY